MWINDLKDKVDALERQVMLIAEALLDLKKRIEAIENAVIKPDD